MIDKLIEKIQKTKAPIVVGLDPMLSYVPEHVQKKAFAEYGETLRGAAEAIWQFNKEIVDQTFDLIPAVKPQIAMYEQFGVEGMEAYKKDCGLLQIQRTGRHRRREARGHRFHFGGLCGGTLGKSAGGQPNLHRL